jgi:hypothetical protein
MHTSLRLILLASDIGSPADFKDWPSKKNVLREIKGKGMYVTPTKHKYA